MGGTPSRRLPESDRPRSQWLPRTTRLLKHVQRDRTQSVADRRSLTAPYIGRMRPKMRYPRFGYGQNRDHRDVGLYQCTHGQRAGFWSPLKGTERGCCRNQLYLPRYSHILGVHSHQFESAVPQVYRRIRQSNSTPRPLRCPQSSRNHLEQLQKER